MGWNGHYDSGQDQEANQRQNGKMISSTTWNLYGHNRPETDRNESGLRSGFPLRSNEALATNETTTYYL